MDRFSKCCLGLIVLLLTVIALTHALSPQPVHAAQTEYSTDVYENFGLSINDYSQKTLKTYLNGKAADGWRLVSVVPMTRGGCADQPNLSCLNSGGYTRQLLFIWQR
jgi:hypothetical protein